MTHKLVYLAEAKADLESIYDWIADQADPHSAFAYVSRIEAACEKLTSFPNRGTPRDEIVPGLRTMTFERRAVIAYRCDAGTVLVVAILHHGRDPGSALRQG